MNPFIVAVRRSWGLYALPLFVGLEIVSLTSRDRIWAIEWQWATSWANAILVILGPLTAGVAAAESTHLRRHGGWLITRQGAAGRLKAHASRALAVGTWAVAAHAAAMAITWIIVASRHHEVGSLEWRLIPPAFLLLIASACVGSAVGWLLPHLIVAPMVAVLGYLLPAASIGSSQLFLVGGSTAPLSGLEYRPDVLVAQSVVWLLCGLVAVVVLLRRSWASAVIATLSVAALVGAAAWVNSLGPDTLRARPVIDFSCVGSSPAVCVPADYREVLSELDAVVRPVVGPLRTSLGPLSVTRVVAFVAPPLPAGSAPLWTWVEPPYTDQYNAATSIVAAASSCPSNTPELDREVALILPGAVPALQAHATQMGLPLLTPEEARAHFDALRDRCSP